MGYSRVVHTLRPKIVFAPPSPSVVIQGIYDLQGQGTLQIFHMLDTKYANFEQIFFSQAVECI